MEKKPLLSLPKGFTDRTLVTARLAGKLGTAYVKASLGFESDQEDTSAAEKAALDMVDQLGSMKGLVMKFGQMASYMPGALPPKAQRLLSQLQADTKAMAFSQVEAQIEADLGKKAAALFDEFEEQPFAAASIGQVHRARLGGRPLAVKIQYPGIEDVLRSDLKTVGLFLQMGSVGTSVDAGVAAAELRDRIIEECDYAREARMQRAFARLFASMGAGKVPAVIAERTGRRVISTEMSDALPFYRFCDTAPQEARDRAGATLYQTCFQSLFQHCVYNADPHPGNYLFAPDGEVTFLDFGCTRAYETAMITRWKRLAASVLDGDPATYRREATALGLGPERGKFDWDYQYEMTRFLYEPMRAREPFRFTHDYVRRSYDVLLFKNPNKMRQAMPAEWLFLNRLQWGLYSILAFLGAQADWPTLFRRAVEAPVEPADLDALGA